MEKTGAEWSSEITTRRPFDSRVYVNVTLGGVTAPSGTDAMKIVKTARRKIRVIQKRIQNSEDRIQKAENRLRITDYYS